MRDRRGPAPVAGPPLQVIRTSAAWKSRPWSARTVGAAWYLLNLAVATGVSEAAAAVYGRPRGWPATALWLVGLSGLSCLALAALRPLTIRIVPLRALLALGLAFPGRAPSRFRIALRAGNPKLAVATAHDALTHGESLLPEAAARTVLDLVAALSVHDAATRGHSERVRAYAELIGEELGLDADARQGLRWAGLIHDVGKLLVPSEVLNKPSALSPEEWDIIRRHPTDGAEIARPLEPWLGEWASGVLDHHERWDGKGYPRRLASTDISLAGRVVAVADAYDVMTSARSYKEPSSPTQARDELVRCAGTQFDPMVVRAFLALSVRKVRAVGGLLPAVLPQLPWLRWRLRPRLGWLVVPFVGGSTALAVGLMSALPAAAGSTVGALDHKSPPGVDANAPRGATTATGARTPSSSPSGQTATSGSTPGAGGAPTGLSGSAPPSVTPVPASGGPGGLGGLGPGLSGPGGMGTDGTGSGGTGARPTGAPGGEQSGTQPSGGQPSDGGQSGSGQPSGSQPSGGQPSDGQPGGGQPGGGQPGGGQPTTASLVVDPSSGSVSVDNLGPAGTPPVPIVQVPAAGGVVCGDAGVCSPVSVPLPLP